MESRGPGRCTGEGEMRVKHYHTRDTIRSSVLTAYFFLLSFVFVCWKEPLQAPNKGVVFTLAVGWRTNFLNLAFFCFVLFCFAWKGGREIFRKLFLFIHVVLDFRDTKGKEETCKLD